MAAAALPAARQITRPFGTGRRCADSTTSGWAAATAASKMARRRGRRSVIASQALGLKLGMAVIHPISAKENPRTAVRGFVRPPGLPHQGQASAADIGVDDVAEQVPPLA